jgi:2-octaprenyl-3-methyl-6-methoxy-1,4-benzoquinol hydroxylase
MNEQFDVVIVGSGMVGAAFAGCLGNTPLKIAVLENELPPPFHPTQPHDLRVSALSIASKTILENIDAWQGIETKRLCPFSRMRVWENEGDTEFRSHDIGCNELGYIVENRIIQLALLEKFDHYKNIECIAPIQINHFHYTPYQLSRFELNNGRVLEAKLVVAADGGQSKIRQRVGLGVTSWDYNQSAMVIYIETANPQQDITWQRFVPTGPQAFLPLPGNYGSIVWYHHIDEIKRLQTLPYDELKNALIEAFPACLGDIKRIIATTSFSLKRQHAQHYVKQGVALIGDAAHTINPLAGQGVNIGLLDAAALAEVILEASQQGRNIADVALLRRYEKMRYTENLKMMTIMDVFYQAFSNKIGPIKILRNIGLSIPEKISPLKNIIMRHAMGLEGHLPKLAQRKY